MGEHNTVMQRWLSDEARFADLFNAAFFDGRQIVKSQALHPADKETNTLLQDKDGKAMELRRYRDIIKYADIGTRFSLLAIENQEEIHYAMPVRGMLYDALSYTEQVRCRKKEHQKKKELKGSGEFLSGWKKGDCLIPCITLVFYYGEKEWDGERDLYQMFGWSEKELSLFRPYLSNYHMNLVDVRRLAEKKCFRSDLQWIFGMLKYRDSKEKLSAYIQENEQYFRNIDRESYEAARVLLGSRKELLKAEKMEQGGIDMCKALEDLYEDGMQKGEQIGMQRGRQLGEEKLARLMTMLLDNGKTDEAIQAASDVSKRNEYYTLYQIQ